MQQSLTTLGSGGWSGVGLGRGWQKLSFLPEANTDFVFAVVGEELGLVGTLGLLGLWAGMYGADCGCSRRCRPANSSPSAGRALLIQLVTQAAVNMAVVTAMAPPKGIAHPLISYGGSSLLASVIALGMIVSLSRGRRAREAASVRVEIRWCERVGPVIDWGKPRRSLPGTPVLLISQSLPIDKQDQRLRALCADSSPDRRITS